MNSRTRKRRGLITGVVAAIMIVVVSGCAAFQNAAEQIEEALQGRSLTMTTFATDGQVIDQVNGKSMRIARDTTFDSTDSAGGSNADSSVLMISIGDNHIRHVGSTLIAAEQGLTTVAGPGTINLTNVKPGMPWLNDFIEVNRNLWKGKGKTILIRSQFDKPLAVYAGDAVEIFATDVPKTTRFRVDGKVLVVYRANYTVYDNELLQ